MANIVYTMFANTMANANGLARARWSLTLAVFRTPPSGEHETFETFEPSKLSKVLAPPLGSDLYRRPAGPNTPRHTEDYTAPARGGNMTHENNLAITLYKRAAPCHSNAVCIRAPERSKKPRLP